MAGRIREEDITLVRERAKIDEIVREYVTLRNAGGGSLKGLCPFHEERSPSFNVSPARGYYHCFGCGEGGDVIDFVQKLDHLSFAETVERLADKVGVQLRYEEGSGATGSSAGRSREQRTRLIEAHRAAAEYYAEQLELSDAVAGRRFLDERGFDREAAARFGVGYAPRDGESLVRQLRSKKFSDAESVAAGLLAEGRSGPYDRFRGRLVWPIRDLMGDVVGFGARRLFDDDRIEAKYLNTPETPIYRKSTVLYGIDLAKKDIAKSSQAVVVEGYTDVMACHLSGVTTAVATCGTAFGDEHAKILRRLLMDQDEFRGEVVFTFDGDAAGQKAALKAFEGDQRFVAQTFVAVEPSGMDPCELRQVKGDDAVRELVSGRQRLFEFAIRSMLAGYDLDSAEGQVRGLERAVPLVAQIRDTSLRDEYARRLAGWVGASDELAVVRRVRAMSARPSGPRPSGAAGGPPRGGAGAPGAGSASGNGAVERRPDGTGGSDGSGGSANSGPSPTAQQAPAAEPPVDPVTVDVERETLRAAVQCPGLAGAAFDELPDEAFAFSPHRTLRRAVAAAGGCVAAPAGGAWVQAVAAACPDEHHRGLVTRLAVEPLKSSEDQLPRYVASLVLRTHELLLARQLAAVKGRLQRTDPTVDPDGHQQLQVELMGLERRRRDLRERALGAA